MKIITVQKLKKHFKVYKRGAGLRATLRSFLSRPEETVKAVDGISFEIEKGELLGFIGPNGAGKTTTLKCLSGLLYPTSGQVKVLGFTPFDRKPEYLKKISLVMGQKNQLWWDLPAIDTFRLNKEIYDIEDSDYERNLAELSQLLEVSHLVSIPVRKLSLGQRMKMELIAALIHRPEVLFLDEPTIGLDVVMQKNMRDFIAQYNRRYQSTILLTSHYMSDVKELCKRVIIIDNGKIIYDGQLDRLGRKYADYKTVTVIFEKPVDGKKFPEMGEVVSFKFPKLVLSVPRKMSKHIAAKILENYPVEDFNIEDPEVEDIVRRVFSEKKV
ncbi:ATP-binding cassette domain-containing protein [Patescibacteria group bacterium]|nr:ATP-binding cassette domain-containing protein [Patescibacteria group bacterium]